MGDTQKNPDHLNRYWSALRTNWKWCWWQATAHFCNSRSTYLIWDVAWLPALIHKHTHPYTPTQTNQICAVDAVAAALDTMFFSIEQCDMRTRSIIEDTSVEIYFHLAPLVIRVCVYMCTCARVMEKQLGILPQRKYRYWAYKPMPSIPVSLAPSIQEYTVSHILRW